MVKHGKAYAPTTHTYNTRRYAKDCDFGMLSEV